MSLLHIPDHGPNDAEPVLNGSSSSSAPLVVNLDWNLNDSQALPIGLPQNFRARTHVCLEWIDGGDCRPGVGSEAALGVRRLPTGSVARAREAALYPDPILT